jgi:glycogen debranching enzyme
MLTGSVALKEDDVQFISNQAGDVPAANPAGYGLYFQDTRFLNTFDLSINGAKPLFLSNSVAKRYIATFQFINPTLLLHDGRRVMQQTVSIRRSRFVSRSGLYERLGFLNCNHFEIELDVVLSFDADFQDIFAIRGFKTQRVAGEITVSFGGERLAFSYKGRDGLKRATEVAFSRPGEAISAREVRFCVKLPPQMADSIVVHVQPEVGESPAHKPQADFDSELEGLANSYRSWDDLSTRIESDNELFDQELLRSSRYDVRTLIVQTEQGSVPEAGIPWYAVPFGRDAIITSLQTLIYNPALAEGTLRYLAAHQGESVDPYTEEEPGKIMHELRQGELARLHDVPHTPYFGTVDATPLFLVLFSEAMDWLGDDRLYENVMPSALRALKWIDDYGDSDDDGYVEYIAHRPGGVVNQGWKDSSDSVQYPDGTSALPPIALVEVQGYVYQAKVGMARLLAAHGQLEIARRLEGDAASLRERFNRDFWMADEGFYAQALDRDKRQIRSVTSNVGHCLWSGICDRDKADAVAERLLAPDMFSGWGLRTLSSFSPNYNPMSYHNGSVWPHDTALAALGLRRAGYPEAATRLVQGMIEAGIRFSDARLPELFCGFERDKRFNSRPTAYVVSCSPQAWSAGSIFMFLQTMLDLRPHAAEGAVHVTPVVPDLFSTLTFRNVRIGTERIDLVVENDGGRARVRMSVSDSLRLEPHVVE